MENLTVQNALINVKYENDRPVVSARELHDFLEVGADYRHWFPRMCEYGFTAGVDFNPVKIDRVQKEGDREVKREVEDAVMTLDMAKEICMLQRNEKGKIARQYFIQLEKDWNSPEKVMARALDIAHKELSTLRVENLKLISENNVMKPKAEYFDSLVDRNTLTGIRDTGKEFHMKQGEFVKWLLDMGFVYRSQDGKGTLKPYGEHVKNGLFELKECKSVKNQWSGTQLMVTPKGRETFRLLLAKEV